MGQTNIIKLFIYNININKIKYILLYIYIYLLGKDPAKLSCMTALGPP